MNCKGATGTKANTQTLFSHFTRSLDFWFFASRQRTERPTSYFLSFFSPDRKAVFKKTLGKMALRKEAGYACKMAVI